MSTTYLVGVDIGGTFTDLVLADAGAGATRNFKTLTTKDPVDGVVTALQQALSATGAPAASISRFVHATTLPTNLVLERKGAKVGFLVTEGFGSMFTFNKQWPLANSAYDLNYSRPPAFVDPEMVFEIKERMTHEGKVWKAFDEDAARAQIERLVEAKPEAIALCLLHSHVNPAHERRLAELVRARLPDTYVAASAEIWPEAGEYERAATAVISAYVGSLFSDYLDRLEARLASEGLTCGVQVMQSSGGVMAAKDCARRAVFAIESGPAAGVMASAHVGRNSGFDDLISFDMGGTTAKAGLIIGGQPRITHDFRVGAEASGQNLGGGEPVRIPVIDLAEVGAGGGSIAWIDRGGALRVGPHSAGSMPGPACYGIGGEQPTVTDANVLLGYLDPDYFLGGKMEIFPERSLAAVQSLADKLGLDVMTVAKGIHDLANTHMGGAVRIVTLHRGHDPRESSIAAFGGAGPLHVVNLAEQFDIPKVIIPPSPGVMSAFGLLISDLVYDYVTATGSAIDEADPAALEAAFAELEAQAAKDLANESDVRLQRSIEVRFTNQSLTMPIDVPSEPVTAATLTRVAAQFRDDYFALSAVRPVDSVYVANCKLKAVGVVTKPKPNPAPTLGGDVSRALKKHRKVCYSVTEGFLDVPVYDRSKLLPGDALAGPAVVEEPESTTIIRGGWKALVDEGQNIVLTRGAAALSHTATETGAVAAPVG